MSTTKKNRDDEYGPSLDELVTMFKGEGYGMAEDDALALAMTVTSALKCADLNEARLFAAYVLAGQALAEEGMA